MFISWPSSLTARLLLTYGPVITFIFLLGILNIKGIGLHIKPYGWFRAVVDVAPLMVSSQRKGEKLINGNNKYFIVTVCKFHFDRSVKDSKCLDLFRSHCSGFASVHAIPRQMLLVETLLKEIGKRLKAISDTESAYFTISAM